MSPPPPLLALARAVCAAMATLLIQRGLRRGNFYAGFWINIAVGVMGVWSLVLLRVRSAAYQWRAVRSVVFSGVVGTAAGRLCKVAAIETVGPPVTAAITNVNPCMSTGLAMRFLGERVTPPIFVGTLVMVLGTTLLSLRGKHVGFPVRSLLYPCLSASCCGVMTLARKLGLGHAGPLFDSAINNTAALVAATTFVCVSGTRGSLACDRRSLRYVIGGGIMERSSVAER